MKKLIPTILAILFALSATAHATPPPSWPSIILTPQGSTSSLTTNGQCATTAAGLYCRINGSVVGPYGVSSGPPSVVWTNCVSRFGADPTGASDTGAAIQNCVNSVAAQPNGGVAYLPTGTYKTQGICLGNGTGTYPAITCNPVQDINLLGDGLFSTQLIPTNTTGSFIFANSDHGSIRNLGINDLLVSQTSGDAIYIRGGGVTVDTVSTFSQTHTFWNGFHVDAGAPTTNIGAQYNINNFSVGPCANNCIQIGEPGSTNPNVGGQITNGNIGNAFDGIVIYSSGGMTVNNVDIISSTSHGVATFPTTGSHIFALFFTNVYTDSGSSDGWYFGTNGGTIADVQMVGCWGSTNNGYGVNIFPAGSNTLDGLTITGGDYINNAKSGILINSGARNVTINGINAFNNSTSGAGTYDAVSVAANTQFFKIVNSQLGQGGATTEVGAPNNQHYGVNVQTGSSDFYIVTNNAMLLNVAGSFDGGSGSNKFFCDNLDGNGACGGGGGGSLTLTDGTHTVPGVTNLSVSGGTVGGSTPNGTLAISGGVTWPSTGDVVISNGTSAPGGVAPIGTNCLVSSGGSWTTGSCGTGTGYPLPDIIGTYGADPTGAADSTTAFQGAAGSGHGVVVESGTYKISGTISVSSNSYLNGVGRQSVTITSSVTNIPMFVFPNGASNAGLVGMTLTRSVTPVSGGDGIRTASTGTLDDVENIKFIDLDINNQWNPMNLGPTNWGLVRDVIVEHSLSDGLIMFNTAGNSGVGSNPLQWTLDHVLSQFNGGRGLTIAGVAETKSPAPAISVGEWKNVSTFANNGVGIGVFGAPTSPFWGFRLGSNSFIGGDGSSEIYLDTWGGNHIIEADIELAGTGPTGPGCPGSCTPPTNVGYGIFITGANSGVNIKANINANSDDGIYTQANLFSALTAPVEITGSQITNNGVAGTGGSRSGVTLASGSGGGVVISGGYIGCWNFNATFCTQQYGLNIATDKISSVGTQIVAGNNASAPYFTSVTLTSNSCLDGLAGGTCGGGGGGSGNVSGPGSSTNGFIPQWAGTGGTNLSTGLPVATSGNNTVVETTGSGLLLPGILPLGTTSAFGAVKCDGSTITCSGGVISATTGGGGTMTSLTSIVNGGVTFSPSTVTTTGTAFLTPCSNNLMLANSSGISQSPICQTLSSYMDSAIGNAQGDLLYRNGSGWVALPPGTAGKVLTTEGSGANPQWLAPNSASLSNPGYIVIPVAGTANNYTREWGNATISSGTSVAVTFPLACTHAILSDPQVTPAASGGVQVSAAAGSVTLSGFTIFAVNSATGGSVTSQPFNWSMECF